MNWDAFQEAHYRPHLVVAILELAAEPASGKSTLALFERLAAVLGMWGNYAIKQEGASIRAAFEIDADAERFAGVLLAKPTLAEPEWSSKFLGRIDRASRRSISTALRQRRLDRPSSEKSGHSSPANRPVAAFPDEQAIGHMLQSRRR